MTRKYKTLAKFTAVGLAVAGMLSLATFPAHARQDDPRLDGLFAELQRGVDPAEARVTIAGIWEIWLESGDAEVDRLMTVGRSAMAVADFGMALANLDQAIAADPEFAEAWNQRATLYYFMGNLDASIHDAERTLELEPRHFGALSGLGLIHGRAGRLETAIGWLERALVVNPHTPNARTNIEWLKQQLGDGSREN